MRARALVTAFVAGVVIGGALLWGYHSHARVSALTDECGDPTLDAQAAKLPEAEPRPDRPTKAVRSTENEVPRFEGDSREDLKSRRLTLPVRGIDAEGLRSSFNEERSGGRRHEAMDILAPRNTPVLAVEDGVIARLFESKAGGLTVYQFDPGYNYAYYYAHLQKYADGLTGGDRVKRGQVLGYVGTSGNAPPNTPHLHFAIFKLTDKKQWWKGTAIDPFTVLR